MSGRLRKAATVADSDRRRRNSLGTKGGEARHRTGEAIRGYFAAPQGAAGFHKLRGSMGKSKVADGGGRGRRRRQILPEQEQKSVNPKNRGHRLPRGFTVVPVIVRWRDEVGTTVGRSGNVVEVAGGAGGVGNNRRRRSGFRVSGGRNKAELRADFPWLPERTIVPAGSETTTGGGWRFRWSEVKRWRRKNGRRRGGGGSARGVLSCVNRRGEGEKRKREEVT